MPIVKPIKWTPKQKKILEALNSGLKPSEIKKKLHISYPLISKVKNAIASGQSPPVKAAKQIKHHTPAVLAPTSSIPPSPIPTTLPADEAGSQIDAEKNKQLAVPTADAVVAELVPTIVRIPMTQVMMSARSYVIQGLHWSPDVKWEDLIDTVFYTYFKSQGIILRGWYEEEPKAREVSPKPAGGKDGGNGLDDTSPELKQLVKLVTNQIIELAKEGKLGG